MKVLILAKVHVVQRFSTALAADGIDVESLICDSFLAFESIESQQYDLVIVDSLFENLKLVCDLICDIDCAPLCLILNEKMDDWKLISGLKVDGFLTKEAGTTELRARIKAACRRKKAVNSEV
jgi:DNA-binding response OmpR family regulator